MTAKRLSLWVTLLGVLAGCTTQPRPRGSEPAISAARESSATAAIASTTDGSQILAADLGNSHCLGPSDATRAQVREVAVAGTGWTAFEDHPGGKNTTCDAGPISAAYLPQSECGAAGNPVILSPTNTDRAEIRKGGITRDGYSVQLKRNDGKVYLKFAATAAFGAKQAKWLKSNTAVHWTDSDGKGYEYDVFIYVVDASGMGAADIPKRFRIEFFNRALPKCVAEEPTRRDMFHDIGVGGNCDATHSANVVILQTPVGDGGTHPPSPQGVCSY
jgi:hypothetical protein